MSPTKAKPKEKPNNRSKRPVKRPGAIKAESPTELVPQAHGGSIYQGTPATIVPGPGRPADVIRARMRGSLESRLSILEQIIDSVTHEASDRLRAIDILAKYGLGTKDELDVSAHPEFAKQALAYQTCVKEAITEALAPPAATRLLADITKRIDALTGGRRE